MSFNNQQNLATQISGINLFGSSAPATVVYNNTLYVFYMGSGDDGIWYTTLVNGKWTNIININNQAKNINFSPNSSPSAVVFNNKIYVFYNGKGNDGTWATVFDGNNWSTAFSVSTKIGGMGFQPFTSPSAAVAQNRLYLFWNGSADDGLFYTSTDGNTWATQARVPAPLIVTKSSPFAVTFGGTLYLFWNGRGNDGTWYTSFSNGKWIPQYSVSQQNGGQNFYSYTSPTALVLADGLLLRLFWVGQASQSGLWYSDFRPNAPKQWTAQKSLAPDIGGQTLKNNSSACSIMFEQTPFVFWQGLPQDIWFTSGLSVDITANNTFGPAQFMSGKKSFTLTVRDQTASKFIADRFPGGTIITPGSSSDAIANFVKTFYDRISDTGSVVFPQLSAVGGYILEAVAKNAYVSVSLPDPLSNLVVRVSIVVIE